jgi:tetratricopeptide (TPR) repeat protein
MYSRKQLLTGMGVVALTLSLIPLQPILGKQTPWDNHIAAARQALHDGNYPEARHQLDDALNDTRTFQANDPRLGETYFCQGELNLNEQNYGQAKQFYQRALELEQKTPGTDELHIADTLYGLANAAEMTGDRELATILLKRVRDIWFKQYGPTSPKLLKVLKPMGIYATVSGDFPTAEQCYRQLVSLEEANSGGNSPQTGSALNLLSLILSRTGKYGESEAAAQRAVTILANAPEYRSMYEQALDNLSFIDYQLGKPAPNVDLGGTAPDSAPYVPVEKPRAIASASTGWLSPAATVSTSHSTATMVAAGESPRSGVGSQSAPLKTITPNAMAPITESVLHKFDYQTQPRSTGPSAPPVAASGTTAKQTPSAGTTQVALRPSTAIVKTGSQDYRPWETPAKNGVASDKAPHINWGTITYLASGKLITPEEYQGMLLANEAYELIRQEKYKMACDILYRALGICPDLASVHTNLGLVLSQMGNRPEAIDQLKQAIAIDPKKSAPWVNLASAFQIDGNLKASVATYAEFVHRFPSHPLAPKAQEIVAHLQKEMTEQSAVETALGASSVAALNDYLAYASHPGQMRWPDSQTTLHVYVQRGDNTVGYRPEYDGFCQQAFRDWSAASGGKVAFEFVKRPDGADIDWQWTNDFSKVSSVAEGGEANVQSSGKTIKHASVTVLTVNPSVDSPLSSNQVQAVCLHEIGHALGLIGHSPRPEDIMFCSMPAASLKPALSQRDIGTLVRLYQQGMARAPRHSGSTAWNRSRLTPVRNRSTAFVASAGF